MSRSERDRLHVVLLAHSRHPIAQPFAGGLEAVTWHLITGLRARGARVTVFAGEGSDPSLGAEILPVPRLELSADARSDVSMPPEQFMREHHAYLSVMLDLARRDDVDVVHNNSLHHLPVAMAGALPMPLLTTLHTPPTPWLESAVATLGSHRDAASFVAVSHRTAAQWAHVTRARVVHNGIDTTSWAAGPGGESLVWFGRIVPEKAPHLAIRIAREAGRRIRLAGPISDPTYFYDEVRPLLDDRAEYVGHLDHDDLAELVGHSLAAVVTPAWDEPYGLVAAEALSCGTPVVGFARGGLPEVIDASSGRLARAGDVSEAARLVDEVARLDRADARRRAVTACSVDRMVEDYLRVYDTLRTLRPAA